MVKKITAIICQIVVFVIVLFIGFSVSSCYPIYYILATELHGTSFRYHVYYKEMPSFNKSIGKVAYYEFLPFLNHDFDRSVIQVRDILWIPKHNELKTTDYIKHPPKDIKEQVNNYAVNNSNISEQSFFYLKYPEEVYRMWMLSSFPVDTGSLVSQQAVNIRIYFNNDKDGEVLVPIKTEKKDQYYKVYYSLEDDSRGYFSKTNCLPDSIKIETEWIELGMLNTLKQKKQIQKFVKTVGFW